MHTTTEYSYSPKLGVEKVIYPSWPGQFGCETVLLNITAAKHVNDSK